MAENKKVLRTSRDTRAELTSKLLSRMIGVVALEKILGAKLASGEMIWLIPEGGEAVYNSLKLTGLVGPGQLVLDSNGNVVIGADPTIDISPLTQWRNGYDDSEDPEYKYGISYTWDKTTRTITAVHTSGTVKFWSNDEQFSFANGSPELSTVIPSENNGFFLYYNGSGQLSSVRDAEVTTEPLYFCIALKTVYDTEIDNGDATFGNEILSIKELHSAFEPIGLRGRMHNTDGTLYSSGAVVSNAIVGQTTIGITTGIAYDEDVKITFAQMLSDGSAIYPKFYFDGKNASADDRIKRGSLSSNLGLYDTEIGIGATGRIVYNDSVAGTFSPQIVGNSNFACAHVFGANGADFMLQVDYTIAIGQEEYNTISAARDGAEDEAASLVVGSAAIKEAVLLYTFILNSSGQLQEVDGDGNTYIDWRVTKTSTIGSGSDLQDLLSVLSVDNKAGNKQIKELAAGTVDTDAANVGQALQDIEGVLTEGYDGGGKPIVNISKLGVGGTPPENVDLMANGTHKQNLVGTPEDGLYTVAVDSGGTSVFNTCLTGCKFNGTNVVSTQTVYKPVFFETSPSGGFTFYIGSAIPTVVGEIVTGEVLFKIATNGNISSPNGGITVTENQAGGYAAFIKNDSPTGRGLLLDSKGENQTDAAFWVRHAAALSTGLYMGGDGNFAIGHSSATDKIHVLLAGGLGKAGMTLDSNNSSTTDPRLLLYRSATLNGELWYDGSAGRMYLSNNYANVNGDTVLQSQGLDTLIAGGDGVINAPQMDKTEITDPKDLVNLEKLEESEGLFVDLTTAQSIDGLKVFNDPINDNHTNTGSQTISIDFDADKLTTIVGACYSPVTSSTVVLKNFTGKILQVDDGTTFAAPISADVTFTSRYILINLSGVVEAGKKFMTGKITTFNASNTGATTYEVDGFALTPELVIGTFDDININQKKF